MRFRTWFCSLLLVSGCSCSGDGPTLRPGDAAFDGAAPDGSVLFPDGATCDGDDREGCPCAEEGLIRPCTSLGGVGACAAGQQVCMFDDPEFATWGACAAGDPVDETCNGIDDDCDGTVDNGFPMTTCGVGACERTLVDCDGSGAECIPGDPEADVCDGVDNDCDGETDEELGAETCGFGACERTVERCVDGAPQTCTPGAPAAEESCGDRIDDDCDRIVDEGCACDPSIDMDFDGEDQCTDCDDANGGVFHGQDEICDGVDQNCDGRIDETFDMDEDGYSLCSDDPLLRDCDDTMATVNPGAPEACGSDNRGNGLDDNCNGRVDETCDPCDATDDDGDGFSECQGDCDDADPAVNPDATEICDGVDNDCNLYTVKNCGVSDPCNFDSGADVCEDDLLCGCVVNQAGNCQGEYICASFCEGSFTGALGGGCTDSQTCLYRVTPTANAHACAESTDPFGTLGGGAACSSAAECRSGICDRLCIGPGCGQTYCVDWCTHHDPGGEGSCAPGSICEIRADFVARCAIDNNGDGRTGDPCSSGLFSNDCLWGPPSCVDGTCAEPCGRDAHCPSGTHCSLLGNSTVAGTWAANLPVTGEPAVETVPVCLADGGSGAHDRQAGAACDQNGDCRSEFCDTDRGVCVSLCTAETSCPVGLDCELQFVGLPNGYTQARICVSNPSPDATYQAR